MLANKIHGSFGECHSKRYCIFMHFANICITEFICRYKESTLNPKKTLGNNNRIFLSCVLSMDLSDCLLILLG